MLPSTRTAEPDVTAPPISSRLPGVGTTIFTVMSQLAIEHRAVNTGQGFPDFEPPAELCERVNHHLHAKHNQYAPMAGVLPLREAIAAKVRRLYRRTASPDSEITVTSGGTDALTTAILAFIHPGDEAILLDPAYDSYQPIIELAGGSARRIPLARPDFGIDWERLATALGPRTRLLMLNSPHNPTGACLSGADLERLAELLRSTRVLVISDEVYEHMLFDGRAHASLNAHPELAERSVIVSSFGKTYHATGWKVGYAVAPPALTSEVRKVHQFVTFATASVLQYAIADFMTAHPEWEAELPAFYQVKRDRMVELLRGSRFGVVPARSTYFQLIDYSAISDRPDTEFALELIRSHGVVSIPVSPFCATAPPAERLVRLCFAKEDATLEEAAARLRRV
jgi:methionine aminotransferase